jgi:nitroreductase/NAD-dependent dihydropyrimidine dehydrogenase PreA subunit
MPVKIEVDPALCTGCMRCVQGGLWGDFKLGSGGKAEYTGDSGLCIECGHCAAVCSAGAVRHSSFPGTPEEIDPSAKPSYAELMSLLKLRRSHRSFKKDPVPGEVIDQLLNAGVLAPSAVNRQTIQYSVIRDPGTLEQISKRSLESLRRVVQMSKSPVGRLFMRLAAKKAYKDVLGMVPKMERIVHASAGGRDYILYNAPCLILLHAPKTDSMAGENAAFNAANILLAAETLGLGACLIGFVTEAAGMDSSILRLASIPGERAVYSALVVGYPAVEYRRAAPKKPIVAAFI